LIFSIRIENFKSLADVSLELGSLNLFLGTNASGKSNFFDALRVLQGIGYGFTVDEILNGKPKTANSDVWEQIRGGSSRATFVGKVAQPTGTPEQIIRFRAKLASGGSHEAFDYSVGISAIQGCVREESLYVDGREIYDSRSLFNDTSQPYFQVRYYRGTVGRQPHFSFEKSRPVLHQIIQKPEISIEDRESVKVCIRALSNTQRIDPSPSVLREYSSAQSWVRRMGEHGENFAALVKTILRNSVNRDRYLSWLKQLTPIEFEDVVILPGALGEPLFALKEGGIDYPAPVLSDGTLRFAAIAAAFFQEDMPDILTIEEIENGIHASRLRLLVELLKTQSSLDWTQVMATTHSPVVLAWLEDRDYKTTFYCKRNEETGASTITPLSAIPNFHEILAKEPISELFAEGWLEATL
jgi:predicted ATPase